MTQHSTWLRNLVLMSAVALMSCTAVHTPDPVLPQRSGVVPGQTISITGSPNVYKIAQDNNVSMRDIIVLNGLQPPYVLKNGQSLVLPFKRSDGSGPVGAASLGVPMDGVSNLSSAGGSVSVGSIQSETLPPIQSQALPPVTSASPVAPAAATALGATALGKTTASAPLDGPVIAQKQVATTMSLSSVARDASAGSDASASAPDMSWPVQGPVVSGFGPKGNGVNNDGVNITAPKGAPVVAAANGIVVYAGDDMKGFGNLVLIRHEGGWVTAYAHLDRVLVSKDAVVAGGDMIGTVGKSGNISSPQLHFEIRHNGKAVDPNGIIQLR